MNSDYSHNTQETCEKLASLKVSVDKDRKTALKKRITRKPQITDTEYLLGAYMEMYEPHLRDIVLELVERGYAIDASSGFAGKNTEYQSLNGNLSIDFVIKNKLEKMGAKFREYNGVQSLIFWPEKATIEHILEKWAKIVSILPNRGKVTNPSNSREAVLFRRKYIPENVLLQRQRLFDRLKFKVQKKVEEEVKARKAKNPHPNALELMLGMFVEELEPQVRAAILKLTKMGYSIDVSGFMENSCDQMIEGDFLLDNAAIQSLTSIGVTVETNPSGYTRIQFSSATADLAKMKEKWNKIVTLLPEIKQTALSSMTKKAREFRMKYQ